MGRKRRSKDPKDLQKRKRPRIIYSSEEDSKSEDEGSVLRAEAPADSNDSRPATPVPPAVEHVPSPSPEPTQPEAIPEPVAGPSTAEDSLDDDILQILGEAPEPENTLGEPIHKDVAARWLEIIKKGLGKELREKISKDYLVPSNCELLVPPILNPEAKAALTDYFIKRDDSMFHRQKQLSVAISALAPVIGVIISECDSSLKRKLLKPISDACRIMCDMHHTETAIRKKFVISSVNTELKDTLVNAGTDKYLFGENMTEKLKAAKTVQKSGESLKITQKLQRSNFTKNFRYQNRQNFKPLQQKTAGKQDAGRREPASLQRNNNRSNAPPPPPPPRRAPPPRDQAERRRTYRR